MRHIPYILRYLMWRAEAQGANTEKEVRIYADNDEKGQMFLAHEPSLKVLDEFLESIQGRKFTRAIDVAGGDGRLALEYLMKHYAKVDYFDQC